MTAQELFEVIYDLSPAWQKWGARQIILVSEKTAQEFNQSEFFSEPVTEDQLVISTRARVPSSHMEASFYAIPVSWLEFSKTQVLEKLDAIRLNEYREWADSRAEKRRAVKRVAQTQSVFTKTNSTVLALSAEAALSEKTILALETTISVLADSDQLVSRLQALIEEHRNVLSAYHDAIKIRDAANAAHTDATAQLDSLNQPPAPMKCMGIAVYLD